MVSWPRYCLASSSMQWLCLPASSTKDSSIVSSTGPISTPWLAEHAHVVLDVLADLQHRRVFQQGLSACRSPS